MAKIDINCNDFYNKSKYSFIIHKGKNDFFDFTKFIANNVKMNDKCKNSIAHIKLFHMEKLLEL